MALMAHQNRWDILCQWQGLDRGGNASFSSLSWWSRVCNTISRVNSLILSPPPPPQDTGSLQRIFLPSDVPRVEPKILLVYKYEPRESTRAKFAVRKTCTGHSKIASALSPLHSRFRWGRCGKISQCRRTERPQRSSWKQSSREHGKGEGGYWAHPRTCIASGKGGENHHPWNMREGESSIYQTSLWKPTYPMVGQHDWCFCVVESRSR